MVNSYTWAISVMDDASGREMIRAAMRAADWPDHKWNVKYQRFGNHVNVEIDIEEKPSQLITLMIEDPNEWYKQESFRYTEPLTPRVAKAISTRLSMVAIFLLCTFAFLLISIRHLYLALFNPQRAKNLAVAIDRAANGALNGNHNETISSRANRARVRRIKWGCMLCKFLDWFKKGHCEDSAGK